MNMTALLDMAPCTLLEVDRLSEVRAYLRHQGDE
jgi:hypothetical protein